MNTSKSLTWITPAVVLLTLAAAGLGLFSGGGSGPFTFTTLHGETVQMYGRGLYQNDTVLIAMGYKISDAFTLVAAIPTLLISFWLYL